MPLHDPDRLADPVLGEPRRYTSREVAKAVGVPMHRARRFWRAMGFANVEDSAVEFTDSDIRALRTLVDFVADGLVDEQQVVHLTRLLGRAAGKLASSHVELVTDRLEEAGIHEDDRAAVIGRQARRMTSDMEWLLGYAWRRHMGAAIHRIDPDLAGHVPTPLGVGFADIAGFTELSSQLSDEDLTRAIERFEGRAADIVAECGGSVVKLLGDEVLFVAYDADVTAEIALRLVEAFRHDRMVPGVHIGVSLGPVVRHLGDVFGTTVNVASRLTAMTGPNTILTTDELAKALASDPHYSVTQVGKRHVRGIGPIAAYRLTRALEV